MNITVVLTDSVSEESERGKSELRSEMISTVSFLLPQLVVLMQTSDLSTVLKLRSDITSVMR